MCSSVNSNVIRLPVFTGFMPGISTARNRTGIALGHCTRTCACSIGIAFHIAAVYSAWFLKVGSLEETEAANSSVSPTCKPSGWILAVSTPSSTALSRFCSRRKTVNAWPDFNTSMAWSPRRINSLCTVSTSVSGRHGNEMLAAAKPCEVCILMALAR
ncbi:hypothetical protein [Novosphingobium sp. SG720]|uniref:hypothetical protein n=1 Tax=Novosphingobium sp. SG720 TaxID=2586998 RepID=UPI001FF0A5F9|nr:hypothetical protein [Novosphingobium sp. SG720]